MKFTINLAFWEMFKKRSPNSASNIQPQYAEEVQTFSVDLFTNREVRSTNRSREIHGNNGYKWTKDIHN